MFPSIRVTINPSVYRTKQFHLASNRLDFRYLLTSKCLVDIERYEFLERAVLGSDDAVVLRRFANRTRWSKSVRSYRLILPGSGSNAFRRFGVFALIRGDVSKQQLEVSTSRNANGIGDLQCLVGNQRKFWVGSKRIWTA
jgi:hypothetical protein